MATIYDLLELNGLPFEGAIIGLPGSGMDVEFLLTETTAEVPGDYYDTILSQNIAAGLYTVDAGPATAVVDGVSYFTAGLHEVAYELGGQSYAGFVVEMMPQVGGAMRTFFLPQDGLGQIEIGQVTILSMQRVGFIDANAAAIDDSVQFLVCFAAGTLLATPTGPRRVEDLAKGDLVSTLDHADLPVLRVEETHVSRDAAARDHRLQLIQIAAGAFAPGVPSRDLRVSRQHRVVVRSQIAHRMFGEEEVLIAAKDLLDWPGVQLLPSDADIRVLHVLLPLHSVLLAEGLAAESLWLGKETSRLLGAATVAEMRHLLYAAQVPARLFVSGGAAQSLVRRHAKNRRGLWEGSDIPWAERNPRTMSNDAPRRRSTVASTQN